jgi:hypothetical protein
MRSTTLKKYLINIRYFVNNTSDKYTLIIGAKIQFIIIIHKNNEISFYITEDYLTIKPEYKLKLAKFSKFITFWKIWSTNL